MLQGELPMPSMEILMLIISDSPVGQQRKTTKTQQLVSNATQLSESESQLFIVSVAGQQHSVHLAEILQVAVDVEITQH